MRSPRRRDLTCYSESFDFEGNGFCPHQWEICVPQKDCITWSVVLSYLRTVDFRTRGEFRERVKRLTGNDSDASLVKRCWKLVRNFNPFMNVHSCFFQETLKKVVESFKTILSRKRSGKKPKVDQDLAMISSLLNCNILLISLTSHRHQLFTPEDDPSPSDKAAITLFSSVFATIVEKPVKRFTFGLEEDLSWELRKSALSSILKSSEINSESAKEIRRLIENKEESFVITLLKNNHVRPVSELYESPYIAAKLSNAGFETDPTVPDKKGLSAFWYALQSGDKVLLYMLYNYAANNCYESENTFREPNSCIVSNFSQLGEIIQNDRSKSNHFRELGDGSEQACLRSEELELFNAFLAKVSKAICDIREEPDGDAVQEASKQKRIILHILEVFDDYFSIGTLDASVSESDLVDNYSKHKLYYDNLDLTVTLLFFDNIILLKGMLRSPQPYLYSDLESILLLSTLINRYFTAEVNQSANKYEHIIKTQDLCFERDSKSLSIIPLLERLKLRENVMMFCRILKEKELTDLDVIEYIPRDEISRMLCKSPEVKDEFLIFRLRHYLSTALKTKPKGIKQKLAIERALQVIGESLKIETESPSSVRHLLRACLPDKTVHTLTRIRNTLSHLESFQYPLKFEKEQDHVFFSSMQSELKSINKAFEIVYHFQRIRLIEFLIRRGLQSLEEFKGHENFEISDNVPPLKESVRGITHLLQRRTSQSLENKFGRYQALWSKLQETTQESLNSVDYSSDSLEAALEKTNTILRPLIDLITFLQNSSTQHDHKALYDFTRQKLEISSSRSLSEVSEKTEDLMRQAKDLLKHMRESESETNQAPDISIENIEAFHRIVTGGDASEAEKNEIRSEIPRSVKIRTQANNELLKDLEEGTVVNSEAFDNLFLNEKQKVSIKTKYEKCLANLEKMNEGHMKQPHGLTPDHPRETKLESLNETKLEQSNGRKSEQSNETKLDQLNKKQLKQSCKAILKIIASAPDPVKTLELVLAKKHVSESKLQTMYDAMQFSAETRNKLSSFTENSKPPVGDNLKNLLNRIDILKKISTEDRPDIQFLYERAISSKTKQYLAYKIVQRYFRESTFQASLEMLFFDCVAILENVNDLKTFWLKSSYLFNGIDVRNVLAHGDPLLDSIGGILDPKDFPSELVKKMLQLFEDQECIKALHDLWQKRKKITSTTNFVGCSEWTELTKHIICCKRWSMYSQLLTEDSKEHETYQKIISHLSEQQPG